jgi:hypothetical protein
VARIAFVELGTDVDIDEASHRHERSERGG